MQRTSSSGLAITSVLLSLTSFIHDCQFSINSLVASTFGVPPKLRVLIIALSPHLPLSVLDFMYNYLPGEELALAKENRRVAVKAAKDLVESKIQETRGEKSGRDTLTLLGASDSWFPIGVSSNLYDDSQHKQVVRRDKQVG